MTWCAALFFGFHRNDAVYRFRLALIDRIHTVGLQHIHAGDYEWCHHAWRSLDRVSYPQMVLHWRPMRWFYRGSFLEIEGLLP
jgi:hypothetical protein